MWKLVAGVVCLSAASAAPVPKDFKKADDNARLVGTWTMTRCNVGGQDTPDRSWQTIVFDADGGLRAVTHDGKAVFEYATVLDPTAAPKRMPFRDKQTKAVLYECVYQLTADGLTISVPHDHKILPGSTDTGPRVTVYQFKRADAK
jgi:uncharacterized protein (TIGR03067 family)